MESKIPLPTDNVYKFYALFGLLLIVTSIVTFAYLHQNTNTLLFEALSNVEELSTKAPTSTLDSQKKELLVQRIAIIKTDAAFYFKCLGGVFAVGIALMALGFVRWHFVIQPRQDKLLELQIKKAEQDLRVPSRVPFKLNKRS